MVLKPSLGGALNFLRSRPLSKGIFLPPALFANAHLLLNKLRFAAELKNKNIRFFAHGLKLCKTLRSIFIPMQFDNEYFDKWLNDRAAKAMEKITNGEQYEQIDVMLLVLKAQTNHIAHMEQDLHGECALCA